MAIKLNAADPVRLAFLLKEIEAVYRKRASRLARPLPSFVGRGAGADLLGEFVRHLKELPLKLDKFGCDPHCNEDPNSCPPCEDWELSECEEYLKSLKIADAVGMDGLAFLHAIHAQYVARVPVEQGRNPNFNLPEFTPPTSTPGSSRLKELFAFHQYLKTLPKSFSDKFGCDPHCADDPNSCPPCEDWEQSHYVAHLESLRKKVSEG